LGVVGGVMVIDLDGRVRQERLGMDGGGGWRERSEV
jgi:hypothetical protein